MQVTLDKEAGELRISGLPNSNHEFWKSFSSYLMRSKNEPISYLGSKIYEELYDIHRRHIPDSGIMVKRNHE